MSRHSREIAYWLFFWLVYVMVWLEFAGLVRL